MYLCVLDGQGQVVLHKDLPTDPAALLEALAPFREDLVIGVECMFSWYWLADLSSREGIPFVLGHALYMGAIHGAKSKNDRIDALKIAKLLAGGMFPMAYVYPRAMRATRDLLRRRLHLVRHRAQLMTHVQNTHHQYNITSPGRVAYKCNREGIGPGFADPSTKASVLLDLSLIEVYDERIRKLELYLVRRAKEHDATAFHRLRTVPGIGKILAMTILYEVHDIARFPRVQDFASYARLVKCAKESAGKRKGTGGAKMGNVHLKWAFSEAAVLFLRHAPGGKTLLTDIEETHGKAKALSILAHTIGRAVYYILSRGTVFSMETFRAAA
jgi:transposase